MHLEGFNLNLLVAFDALVTAPTLTEAAQRLSLTQPALSGALRKLRAHYGDPLILYASGGARLTPLAQRLAPVIRQTLVSARDTIKLSAGFDPRTDAASFDIRAADWVELVFLKDVLGPVITDARLVKASILPARPRSAAEDFADGADLVLTATSATSPGHPREHLFDDRFACIAWRDNPHVDGGRLDQATYAGLSHAAVIGDAKGFSAADAAFRGEGGARQVALRTSMHAALPHLIVGTELLAVTSQRFAEQVARTLPIVPLALPFAVPLIEIVMQWQPYRDHDPAMMWLCARLRDHAAHMPSLKSMATSGD